MSEAVEWSDEKLFTLDSLNPDKITLLQGYDGVPMNWDELIQTLWEINIGKYPRPYQHYSLNPTQLSEVEFNKLMERIFNDLFHPISQFNAGWSRRFGLGEEYRWGSGFTGKQIFVGFINNKFYPFLLSVSDDNGSTQIESRIADSLQRERAVNNMCIFVPLKDGLDQSTVNVDCERIAEVLMMLQERSNLTLSPFISIEGIAKASLIAEQLLKLKEFHILIAFNNELKISLFVQNITSDHSYSSKMVFKGGSRMANEEIMLRDGNVFTFSREHYSYGGYAIPFVRFLVMVRSGLDDYNLYGIPSTTNPDIIKNMRDIANLLTQLLLPTIE